MLVSTEYGHQQKDFKDTLQSSVTAYALLKKGINLHKFMISAISTVTSADPNKSKIASRITVIVNTAKNMSVAITPKNMSLHEHWCRYRPYGKIEVVKICSCTSTGVDTVLVGKLKL